MGRSDQKNRPPSCAEPINGSARSELIKLIRHRLHEPLGPTLLVLQLCCARKRFRPRVLRLFGCFSAVSKKKYAPSANCCPS
jgi:hypothetical protein